MAREINPDGPNAGWTRWRRDNDGRFASMLGDFLFRQTDSGDVICRMETGLR